LGRRLSVIVGDRHKTPDPPDKFSAPYINFSKY